MTANPINHNTDGMKMSRILLAVFIAELSIVASLQAVELPPELPLWEKPPRDYAIPSDVKEQVRSSKARPGSPSGLNRVFSSVPKLPGSVIPTLSKTSTAEDENIRERLRKPLKMRID